MGTAVVVRDHFDVFVTVTPIELVLKPEIGEVDRLVEVREVVLVRPGFDLARVAIRSPVAVWPAAVVLLEPLLVLPLEVVLEHDATDVRALLAKPLLGAQVRAIERGVMRQFPRPADPCVELLMALVAVTTLVVAIATVLLEQAAPAIGQCQNPFASVERYALHQTLIL